jgi:iron complex outermembrane receptor protein
VSFSGGTRATQYRASLNYFDQQGVVLANGLQRYQGRINGTTRAFNDKLQLGLNLTSSQVRNKYLATENTGGFEGGVFTNAVTFNPTRPRTVTDPVTGAQTYFEVAGQTAVRNPVALAEELNDRANTTRTLGNVTAAYSILPTLTASANVGVDRSSGLRQTYFPAANPVGSLTNGLARQANRNVSTATAQTLLTLNQPIGENQTLEIVGGYEYSATRLGDFSATAQNFLTDAFAFNNLGAGAQLLPPVSSDTNRVLASVFSRVNYGIRDKYFLTGVIRRDGSSVFGPNNKYAGLPAISGSWRVSEESFMENTPFSTSGSARATASGQPGDHPVRLADPPGHEPGRPLHLRQHRGHRRGAEPERQPRPQVGDHGADQHRRGLRLLRRPPHG